MLDRRTWSEVRELVKLAAPIAFAQAGQGGLGAGLKPAPAGIRLVP